MSAPWDVGRQRHGLISGEEIIARPYRGSKMCVYCDLSVATHDEWCTHCYPGTVRPAIGDLPPRMARTLEILRAMQAELMDEGGYR